MLDFIFGARSGGFSSVRDCVAQTAGQESHRHYHRAEHADPVFRTDSCSSIAAWSGKIQPCPRHRCGWAAPGIRRRIRGFRAAPFSSAAIWMTTSGRSAMQKYPPPIPLANGSGSISNPIRAFLNTPAMGRARWSARSDRLWMRKPPPGIRRTRARRLDSLRSAHLLGVSIT